MNCLKNQSSICTDVLDALPQPLFVVDSDVRIVGCNPAAAAYLGTSDTAIYHRRGGEVMNCIHSTNGCGLGSGCGDCIIRRSVRLACQGHRITRQKASLRVEQDGQRRQVQLWVTATPFPQQDHEWALVVMEDVTELLKLRGLLPICAQCKKVRDSKQYWHEVSVYLHENLDLDFTHGLCPECLENTLSEIRRQQTTGIDQPVSRALLT